MPVSRRTRRQPATPEDTLSSEEEVDDLNDDMEELDELDDEEEVTDMQDDMDDEEPVDEVEEEEEEEDEIEDEIEDDNDDLEEEEEEDDDDAMNDSQDLADSDVEPKSRPSTNKKRKKGVYEELGSDVDDQFSDTEVVTNRPLTKRQRAKLNNEGSEQYLELPMESMKKKHLTEEEQTLRRSEVARRRKNQSIQRAEKDKEDTINRLLKKQASKSRRIIKDDVTEEKDASPRSQLIKDPNQLHYVNKVDGSVLAIPDSMSLEAVFGHLSERKEIQPPKHCEVEGCGKIRKYTASKSGKAVCSLEHYKVVEAV